MKDIGHFRGKREDERKASAWHMDIVGPTTPGIGVDAIGNLQTGTHAIIFANGFSSADADFPKSRIEVMELFRTEQDGIGEAYKRYVWGRNGSGEVRAELVGVLEQESISYFISNW